MLIIVSINITIIIIMIIYTIVVVLVASVITRTPGGTCRRGCA